MAARCLEAARAVDTVLLDKTGTVTAGAMTLDRVVAVNGAGEDGPRSWAAAAESGSEHPIARAVLEGAVARGRPGPGGTSLEVQPGAGATAMVDGDEVRVSRPVDLPHRRSAPWRTSWPRTGSTVFAVWRAGIPYGLVAVDR